jgi:integrase
MDSQAQTNETLPAISDKSLNIYSKQTAIARDKILNSDSIPHISAADVKAVLVAVGGRYRDRDRLLIMALFDGALRVSECLAIIPGRLVQTADGCLVKDVQGKSYRGQLRIGDVAISQSLYSQIMAYCYQNNIAKDEHIFPVTRSRVFQIVQKAMAKAGIRKPSHVGAVHVLRHSGCIERLRATGNPRAVQVQLRHKNAAMTLRYMKTLSDEESLKIQQGVEFGW